MCLTERLIFDNNIMILKNFTVPNLKKIIETSKR